MHCRRHNIFIIVIDERESVSVLSMDLWTPPQYIILSGMIVISYYYRRHHRVLRPFSVDDMNHSIIRTNAFSHCYFVNKLRTGPFIIFETLYIYTYITRDLTAVSITIVIQNLRGIVLMFTGEGMRSSFKFWNSVTSV